jgi:hypothetical protein
VCRSCAFGVVLCRVLLGAAGLAVVLDAVGVDAVTGDLPVDEPGGVPVPGVPDVVLHAASVSAARTNAARRDELRGTRPGCHAVPIKMRGWVDGASQRIRVTSLACGIATQPAVARPSVTCRKNAEPCGYAAAPDGVLMTTA